MIYSYSFHKDDINHIIFFRSSKEINVITHWFIGPSGGIPEHRDRQNRRKRIYIFRIRIVFYSLNDALYL